MKFVEDYARVKDLRIDNNSDEVFNRRVVWFPNGFGASVIQGEYSYGGKDKLYEVAVKNKRGLCYTTDITNNVIGFLTKAEVIKLLGRIGELTIGGKEV